MTALVRALMALIRGVMRLTWRAVWAVGWRLALVVMLIVGGAVAYDYTTLPPASSLLDGRAKGSVTLLDRTGTPFAWRGDQFGGVVTAKSVSPYLKDAVIATEDKRFYYHPGVDPIGIVSAIRINLREGRGPLSGNGGSTITQQTAKLLCFGNEYDEKVWKSEADYIADCRRSSLWRKAREAVYAMALEAKYTKDQILSIYLNRAYLGAGAYGAEAAAQRYFAIHAGQLDPAQSAMLAGLLTAPSTLAPTANLKRSQRRAAVVVGLMRNQGYLTPAQAQQALAHPATPVDTATDESGSYFADWVMTTGPDFFTRGTTEDVIIKTTMDLKFQKAAEEVVRDIYDTKIKDGSKAQVAVVVMSADGAVRAMVGGRDVTAVGAFNRAVQAKRQTGSAFKPFVYATALDLGYTPNSTVVDAPYCIDIPGSGRWCPENYTHKHYGEVTFTQALVDSLNVPAVKVSEEVGRDLVRKVATGFGIKSNLAAGPALALGASDCSVLEMTGAYAGILNGGSAVKPYGLQELRLKGDDAVLMGASGGIRERIIRKKAARELVYMMNQVVEHGTGHNARLPGRQVAGKTGTSQQARDAWFVGFTADYVAAVWMGYDDNTPLTGVTGAGLPAEIWHDVMARVEEGQPAHPLPMIQPESLPPQADRGWGRGRGGRMNPIERLLRGLFGGN